MFEVWHPNKILYPPFQVHVGVLESTLGHPLAGPGFELGFEKVEHKCQAWG
jgi:hypothetical protein